MARNSPSAAAASIPWFLQSWLWALLLLLGVVIAYLPVWSAGFVWDDDSHLTANPCIVGPLGFKEIWTTSAAWYYPLTLSTFWFEHALWKLNPLPYHLVNVLLQGASAIVLWRVLLSLQIPGAWMGAALWAIHPVQVESIAWITEQKNTQSGLFYLLAILFFIEGLKARRDGENKFDQNDALTWLFAAMAMTSKSSTVILPLVLCLCAWWLEKRINFRTLLRTVPVFLISFLAAAVTIWTVRHNAVDDHSLAARSLLERIAVSGDVFWFYLGKLAWPYPLIFIYPRWQIDPSHIISYVPTLAMIAVLALLWIYRKTWSRPWLFAFAYFFIALLPVLGLVNQYFWRYSFVGDHFQYLASMGPLALLGAGLSRFRELFPALKLRFQWALFAVVLLVLGILSWYQARAYQSEETLWRDTLAKNPACPLASNNLGNILARKGKVEEAKTLFLANLKLDPTNTDLLNSLGNLLLLTGHTDDAKAQFQKAIEIDPANFGAYNNLGIIFAEKGQLNEAIIRYEQAIQINPRYADAHNNLGTSLLQTGQLAEAMEQFHKAIAIMPNYADAHNNLGWALMQKGQIDDGIKQFRAAIAIDPNYIKGRNNLGIALAETGHLDEAILEFQEALQIQPNDLTTQTNLAKAQLLYQRKHPLR